VRRRIQSAGHLLNKTIHQNLRTGRYRHKLLTTVPEPIHKDAFRLNLKFEDPQTQTFLLRDFNQTCKIIWEGDDSKRDDQEKNLQYKKHVAQKPKETIDLVKEETSEDKQTNENTQNCGNEKIRLTRTYARSESICTNLVKD
jgi:hypothetical protein